MRYGVIINNDDSSLYCFISPSSCTFVATSEAEACAVSITNVESLFGVKSEDKMRAAKQTTIERIPPVNLYAEKSKVVHVCFWRAC